MAKYLLESQVNASQILKMVVLVLMGITINRPEVIFLKI